MIAPLYEDEIYDQLLSSICDEINSYVVVKVYWKRLGQKLLGEKKL